jgi:hypothetical protein
VKSFQRGQRIRIEHTGNGEIDGRTGIVERLRHCDDGAWVRMDADVPSAYRVFPDEDDRRNNLCLYPYQCEPAAAEVEGAKRGK